MTTAHYAQAADLFGCEDAEPKEGSWEWSKREMEKIRALSAELGGLITQSQAGLILGISAGAVAEYVRRGKLRKYEVMGGKYIGGNEIMEFAMREKLKGGRPSKVSLWVAGLNRS